MKITVLGSGTSHGIPAINCHCKCCTSKNPKDTRWRCSIKVETSGGTVAIVDTGPEFRLQALKYGLKKLDVLFLTHSHADHLNGLDDVRIFSHTEANNTAKSDNPLHIYSHSSCLKDVENRFDYAFKTTQIGGGKPLLKLVSAENFSEKNPIVVGDLSAIPVPMKHGEQDATGWIFREGEGGSSFAYLTDCSIISDSSLELAKDCESVIIDALRGEEHPTHLSFEQAVGYIKRLNGKNFYFTHMSHENTDDDILEIIGKLKSKYNLGSEKNIQTAWDGLEILC